MWSLSWRTSVASILQGTMTESQFAAILLLPLAHYAADFELQNNRMALMKSKEIRWLTAHVAIYSTLFMVLFGVWFGVITFVTHFVTDFVTSKWSRRKFPFVPSPIKAGLLHDHEGRKGRSRHRFFCVIGLDQMIHAYTLLLTVIYCPLEGVFGILRTL